MQKDKSTSVNAQGSRDRSVMTTSPTVPPLLLPLSLSGLLSAFSDTLNSDGESVGVDVTPRFKWPALLKLIRCPAFAIMTTTVAKTSN